MAWEWVAPVSAGVTAIVSAGAVAWTARQGRVRALHLVQETAKVAADAAEAEREAHRRDALDDEARERRARRATELREATAELDARIDNVKDLYEALWYSLHSGPDGWNSRDAADAYQGRTIDAWDEYQRARATVRGMAPQHIDAAYALVRGHLESLWLHFGELYYAHAEKPEDQIQACFDRLNDAVDHVRALNRHHLDVEDAATTPAMTRDARRVGGQERRSSGPDRAHVVS